MEDEYKERGKKERRHTHTLIDGIRNNNNNDDDDDNN